MSHRREASDGGFTRGSASPPQRGNPVPYQVKNGKSAVENRARRRARLNESDELFGGEAESSDRYIITYADLITLLLGLFILLYASSNVDLQKYRKVIDAAGNFFGTIDTVSRSAKPSGNGPNAIVGTKSKEEADPLKKLQTQLEKIVEEERLGKSIKLVNNERGVTIRILDDILFRSGQAELTDYSRLILRKLGLILKTMSNDIRIEGHTDNVPISGGLFASNWHLSVARATNAAYYLMNQEGVTPARVSVVGCSEYHPIASNDTPEGRANNRRVDIIILKK